MSRYLRIIILAVALLCCQEKVSAQYNFSKVDLWLTENIGEMGGRAILVIYKDNHLIYNHAVNKMNMRQKLVDRFIAKKQRREIDFNDYTPAKRQPIASCSKWLSAALVMTFVDEGKLKLTDTVGQYLPVLSRHKKGMITISQCLSHLTAIKGPSPGESLEEMRNTNSMEAAIDTIALLHMEGEPGHVFHYSNIGLQIAGAVIEKISGESFETLFAERIARPLDMKNTDFGNGKVALPAGGAGSTPEDYLNFLIMILDHGTFNGKKILSENSIAEMQVNRITPAVRIAYSPAEAGGFGYGYGEWVMDEAAVTSPGLFGSFPWIDNDKKYAAFLMTFYLGSEGRNERYKALKKLTDEAVSK
jgi:CubicO group peptidase (beta-lactamase class C family)